MNTHVPGFQSLFRFFASFLLAKLANTSIRVKGTEEERALLEHMVTFNRWSLKQI